MEDGVPLNDLLAGHITRNLKQIEEHLKLKLVARDYMILISGSFAQIEYGKKFFRELTAIYHLCGCRLEQNDFEQTLKAFRDRTDGSLRELFNERIQVGRRKRDIVPRSRNQLNYIRLIREKDIVFGIGAAGTGKTYLAMAMAVSELLKGNVNRIILTRPAKEAGENLGFLPGTLEDKIMPYLRPLYDALYDMIDFEEASQLMSKNIIEVAPLAFMRGRTLNNAFVILDEAQNTTEEQMLMFLTRLGFDSQCVITGDPSQNDLNKNEKSGLVHAAQTLQEITEIGFCRFSTADVVRHALVEKIIKAYESEKRV
ncbi:MAG: PhoH family protein [Victivallaceae bacterium]|nr:PhoH family protein [Victivallaceae bacterium]MDD5663656.1 PhoH family protein [Victivallaceae bacterium]